MKKAIVLISLICICLTPALAGTQKPLTSVPFELEGEKTFIKGRVNGSEEINLLFDTGAGASVIDETTAARLGLVASGQTVNEGSGSSSSVPFSANNTIEVNGLKFPGINLMHIHLGQYLGTRKDVIIGYQMLKRYVIKIDHDTKMMEFYDAKSFRYTGNGRVNRFSIWSDSAFVEIKLTLLSGEKLRGKYMVDTGGDLPLILNSPIVNKKGLMQKVGKVLKGGITGSNGEEVPTFRGMVQKAEIGGYVFSDFPVRLAQAQAGTLALTEIDGVLGNPILKKFNITYDYSRRKMYWEPNQLFSQKVR